MQSATLQPSDGHTRCKRVEDFSGLESQSPVGVWKANRRAQAEDIPVGRGKSDLSWRMRLSLELRVGRGSKNIEYRREEV